MIFSVTCKKLMKCVLLKHLSATLIILIGYHILIAIPTVTLSERGRPSGGAMCFIRKRFCDFVQFIPTLFHNILILKLFKSLVKSAKDVLLAGMCIPPSSSDFYDKVDVADDVSILEQCLLELEELYEFVLSMWRHEL